MKENNQKDRLELLSSHLRKACTRLEEIYNTTIPSSVEQDATIQRFEFVFELVWKMFKEKLKAYGVIANTPRDAISGAYKQEWIKDEILWLQMMKDRNLTAHTYNEKLAEEIFHKIQQYAPELIRLAKEL